MALLAMSIPIMLGKTAEWQKFAAELKGPRRADFVASRKRLGVRERTFLQATPLGDLVVVTLEGDDPAAAMAKIGQGTDEFSQWFIAQVKVLHGMDLTKPPPGPLPELITDSEG
ncbi:MAG TPA: hypothetical protein VGP93_16245 [Polyangiaceae bacterium]|jgi:hypothetical protein|nr:hypothetical protein [Polyangiaceae bacterium]